MTKPRMWVIAVVFALWSPGVASAQGLIDFIESLSGPGPFRGGGAVWRIACAETDTPGTFRGKQGWNVLWNCWNDSSENIRQIVEIRGLVASTSGGKRPVLVVDPADTRSVTAYKLDMIAAIRLAPFLDVGAGGGYIGFNVDDGPTVHRPLFVPASITYTPLAAYGRPTGPRRLVRIRLDVNYIPFGFIGEDWGKPEISTLQYSTDGNWVLSGGLLLDFGSFRN